MLIIGLDKVGGWEALSTPLRTRPRSRRLAPPQSLRRPDLSFLGLVLGAIYGGTFYWGVDQVNVQRMLGAKNLDHARWGAMFAILLKLTPAFIFALPGVIALVLYPGREPPHDFRDRA